MADDPAGTVEIFRHRLEPRVTSIAYEDDVVVRIRPVVDQVRDEDIVPRRWPPPDWYRHPDSRH